MDEGRHETQNDKKKKEERLKQEEQWDFYSSEPAMNGCVLPEVSAMNGCPS